MKTYQGILTVVDNFARCTCREDGRERRMVDILAEMREEQAYWDRIDEEHRRDGWIVVGRGSYVHPDCVSAAAP